MKKITLIALVAIIAVSMCACGKRGNGETTYPTRETAPITVPTVPDMTMPSSNIPDPTVDSNSTMSTNDATDNTDSRMMR